VAPVDEAALGELTHGFHSYPARFHPLLPRRLLEAHPAAARVLDPFVGSGTTLVEAAVAGRRGFGVDVNPLAVALARLKATPWDEARRTALVEAAAAIVARSSESVRASRKRSARSREQPEPRETRFDDPRRYPPHVYRELVGLRLAIDHVAPQANADPALRSALLLALSSIVVKVSLQRSDTDERLVERTIARGAATRLYARRVDELAARMAELFARVPPGTPPPDVRVGDARRLRHLGPGAIDLVVTSPPYLGTYDYAAHHARRFGWLGLDTRSLRDEIGARRGAAASPREALDRWAADVAAWVAEIARVLSPAGRAFVLIGDSVAGDRAVAGDEEVRRAADAAGLRVLAAASQARPEVYRAATARESERREHLLALARR